MDFETVYTPKELGKMWKLDRTTIQKMFRDEEGVFKYSVPSRRKREYVTLRIPASVANRVYQARTK